MIGESYLITKAGSEQVIKQTLELVEVSSDELISEFFLEMCDVKEGMMDKAKAIFLILAARLMDADDLYTKTKGSLNPFLPNM